MPYETKTPKNQFKKTIATAKFIAQPHSHREGLTLMSCQTTLNYGICAIGYAFVSLHIAIMILS